MKLLYIIFMSEHENTKSTNSNKNKVEMKKLYVLFVVEIILAGIVFFSGGSDFFKNGDRNTILLIIVGMLTFVSVFFSFIYSNVNKWLLEFHKIVEATDKELKEKARESLDKDLNVDYLREIAVEKESLVEFEKKINPELWLYLSVILYLSTMALCLLTQSIYVKYIEAVFFHFGFLFTFWLITSIFCLVIIVRQKETKN